MLQGREAIESPLANALAAMICLQREFRGKINTYFLAAVANTCRCTLDTKSFRNKKLHELLLARCHFTNGNFAINAARRLVWSLTLSRIACSLVGSTLLEARLANSSTNPSMVWIAVACSA